MSIEIVIKFPFKYRGGVFDVAIDKFNQLIDNKLALGYLDIEHIEQIEKTAFIIEKFFYRDDEYRLLVRPIDNENGRSFKTITDSCDITVQPVGYAIVRDGVVHEHLIRCVVWSTP